MYPGNMSATHFQLLRKLSFAETERLYLQSWILNIKNTHLAKDPDFKKLFRYQVRKK